MKKKGVDAGCVDTGITIVYTIHQPSIDIFEAFELYYEANIPLIDPHKLNLESLEWDDSTKD